MCVTIYLRTQYPNQSHADISLLFSKTKVKPIPKKGTNLTIPRLELISVMLGSKALKFVLKHLNNIPIDPMLNLWTDSSTVLAWLNTTTIIRDIFVQNRINTIRSVNNLIVRHTPGVDNPADIGTRGVPTGMSLQSMDIWWSGPTWLKNADHLPSCELSIKEFCSNNHNLMPSNSNAPICTFQVQNMPPIIPESLIDISRFSRMPKLLRSTSYLFRFIIKTRKETQFKNIQISLKELRFSLNFLIKQEQTQNPPPDRDNEALGLFSDNNGIIRSKGRLGNSLLPISTQEPIYLPPHSSLTKLIIYETHLVNHHSSPLSTLSFIRRLYWIPKGRRIVARAIHLQCLPCRRFSAIPYNIPPFPNFPTGRVRQARPFISVGVDFCGPLYCHDPEGIRKTIRSKIPTIKYWICFWVCLTTRAISLDLVKDQSAPTFVLAFRRFCARFGSPTTFYSDQAPTFVSFRKMLLEKSQYGPIEWNLRTPFCPWKGGHYERLVGLIKYHLRRTLSKGTIPSVYTSDHIQTILTEIELIINSRPITFDSSNPADPRPLRPIDFFRPLGYGNNLPPFLTPDTTTDLNLPRKETPTNDTFQSLWSSLSQYAKYFWVKWKNEYLLSLREQYKKLSTSNDRWPKEGEFVLLFDSNTPRSLWPTARVTDIFQNTKGIPDTVSLKLIHSGRQTTRSISHIYPLELQPFNSNQKDFSDSLSEMENEKEQTPQNTKRDERGTTNKNSHSSQPAKNANVPLPSPTKNYIQLRSRRIERK
uniref:Integrase catalytic domain-containing protein n=1 Tax=Meloidogyne incognita TaxID=6306 RepID=A0A914LDH4_MELIC